MSRPTVTVWRATEPSKVQGQLAIPDVMKVPMRPDIVCQLVDRFRLNSRTCYAVKVGAGYGTSAESWGTGRAVARIPRVPGGGTHRAGQGAFGNMCRGGGMFAPTKVWRRWTRISNQKVRRLAVASAIAASAVPALVMARGHRIEEVREMPLVVTDHIECVDRTRKAKQILHSLGLESDLDKVCDTKTYRAGKGKRRNRKYKIRKGPLIVYAHNDGIVQGFRNLPGVDLVDVKSLHLELLAPGGMLGRMVVWSESAFKELQNMYGDYSTTKCPMKRDFVLPRPLTWNSDIPRLINSAEVQAVVRPAYERPEPQSREKPNPLKNYDARVALDPAFPELSKMQQTESHAKKRKADHDEVTKAKQARTAVLPDSRTMVPLKK